MLAVTHHPEITKSCWARWCGPSALSAVTGLSVEECAAAINRVRGRAAYYQTQGVYPGELKGAGERLGFRISKVAVEGKPTIRQFLQARSADHFLGRLILMTRDHFIAVRETTLADNHHPDGIPWRKYGKLKSRVVHAYLVEQIEEVIGLDDWSPKQHSNYARKSKREPAKKRAQRIADSLGVVIHDHGDMLELEAPTGKNWDGGTHFEAIPVLRGEKHLAWSDAWSAMRTHELQGFDDCANDGCDCLEED